MGNLALQVLISLADRNGSGKQGMAFIHARSAKIRETAIDNDFITDNIAFIISISTSSYPHLFFISGT